MQSTKAATSHTSMSAFALALAPLALAGAIAVAAAIGTPVSVKASPAFSSQTGKPCTACHTAPPQLNDYGKAFKAAGNKEPKK